MRRCARLDNYGYAPITWYLANVLEFSVLYFSNIIWTLREYANEGDSSITSLILALIHW
jgi:hypothetical protein